MAAPANLILSFIAWALILYQMAITQFLFQSYMQNQIVHVGLVGSLLSLYNVAGTGKPALKLLWLAVFVVSTSYMWLNFDDLEMRIGFPEGLDIPMGCLLLVGIPGCTLAAWGRIFPTIAGSRWRTCCSAIICPAPCIIRASPSTRPYRPLAWASARASSATFPA